MTANAMASTNLLDSLDSMMREQSALFRELSVSFTHSGSSSPATIRAALEAIDSMTREQQAIFREVTQCAMRAAQQPESQSVHLNHLARGLTVRVESMSNINSRLMSDLLNSLPGAAYPAPVAQVAMRYAPADAALANEASTLGQVTPIQHVAAPAQVVAAAPATAAPVTYKEVPFLPDLPKTVVAASTEANAVVAETAIAPAVAAVAAPAASVAPAVDPAAPKKRIRRTRAQIEADALEMAARKEAAQKLKAAAKKAPKPKAATKAAAPKPAATKAQAPTPKRNKLALTALDREAELAAAAAAAAAANAVAPVVATASPAPVVASTAPAPIAPPVAVAAPAPATAAVAAPVATTVVTNPAEAAAPVAAKGELRQNQMETQAEPRATLSVSKEASDQNATVGTVSQAAGSSAPQAIPASTVAAQGELISTEDPDAIAL